MFQPVMDEVWKMKAFNYTPIKYALAAASCAWALTSASLVSAAEAELPVIMHELVAPPAVPAPYRAR